MNATTRRFSARRPMLARRARVATATTRGAARGERNSRTGRLGIALAVVVGTLTLGTVGFVLSEHWSAFEALYVTVVTVTNIGAQHALPKSTAGRAITMALALAGVTAYFYFGSELMGAIVGGELQRLLGRRRMEHTLDKVREHIVVCGYSRMGRRVCDEFAALGLPVVVIERDATLLDEVDCSRIVPLHGDATSDEVLRRAGVPRARALIVLLDSDADSLFITMSARFLNEGVVIVARADDQATEEKLLRAGASRVISPFGIGGQRVAQAVLRPAVVDFLELATRSEALELRIDETRVAAGSVLAGTATSELRRHVEVILLAIRKPSGAIQPAPAIEAIVEVGDVLITVGGHEQQRVLALMATQPARR